MSAAAQERVRAAQSKAAAAARRHRVAVVGGAAPSPRKRKASEARAEAGVPRVATPDEFALLHALAKPGRTQAHRVCFVFCFCVFLYRVLFLVHVWSFVSCSSCFFVLDF